MDERFLRNEMMLGPEAVEKLASYAKEQGKITAYDPNWRPPL